MEDQSNALGIKDHVLEKGKGKKLIYYCYYVLLETEVGFKQVHVDYFMKRPIRQCLSNDRAHSPAHKALGIRSAWQWPSPPGVDITSGSVWSLQFCFWQWLTGERTDWSKTDLLLILIYHFFNLSVYRQVSESLSCKNTLLADSTTIKWDSVCCLVMCSINSNNYY